MFYRFVGFIAAAAVSIVDSRSLVLFGTCYCCYGLFLLSSLLQFCLFCFESCRFFHGSHWVVAVVPFAALVFCL